MPEVCVVIPARDAAATLPRTLAALEGQTLSGDRFEVVVVDDCSSDATAEIAEASAVVDVVVRLGQGVGGVAQVSGGAGPGAARNAGVRATKARLIAFTDADCFPRADWLERGVAALGEADLVQGRVVPERPPGPHDRTVHVPGLFGLFETANLLVHRGLFDRLGGFEPGWSPLGGKELGEDTWLGWRARRLGAQIAFAEDAVVEHAVVERGRLGYAAERRGLVAFPALVERMPELRSALCWRRAFLSRRGAAFDAAVVGLVAAAATRRKEPLALALPYLAERPTPTSVAADAIGAVALAAGSVRSRSLLL